MNVNQSGRSAMGSSAATSRARQASEEDCNLSELLRTLRSLAADSPERQAKIENLMRAYAAGQLQVDAEDTASAIIDEALVAGSTFH